MKLQTSLPGNFVIKKTPITNKRFKRRGDKVFIPSVFKKNTRVRVDYVYIRILVLHCKIIRKQGVLNWKIKIQLQRPEIKC